MFRVAAFQKVHMPPKKPLFVQVFVIPSHVTKGILFTIQIRDLMCLLATEIYILLFFLFYIVCDFNELFVFYDYVVIRIFMYYPCFI